MFGEKLRRRRETQKPRMTQQDLAMKAGLSIRIVAALEVGETLDPRVSTVGALAWALGCSFDTLLGKPHGPAPAKGRRKAGG
jgi:predicted transcriptional regulator